MLNESGWPVASREWQWLLDNEYNWKQFLLTWLSGERLAKPYAFVSALNQKPPAFAGGFW